MMNVTGSFMTLVDPAMESNATYNGTRSPNNTSYLPEDDGYYSLTKIAAWIFILLVSLFGMAVNGTVICILGCHAKGNSFTTYVVNLSVADFGLLTAVAPISICSILNFFHYMDGTFLLEFLLPSIFLFTYSTSQFLLAAISMDRCVCLFFPLWHKCHRPPRLSILVCVTIWILTFLMSAIDFALTHSIGYTELWNHQFLLNIVLCMPTMLISATAMLIKVFFLSPHHKQRKLLTAILLALLFFLFFGFPINTVHLVFIYRNPASFSFKIYAFTGAILNSAINPILYFLVGRDKNVQSGRRIRETLEKLFQGEEESYRENVESPLESHI